MSGMTPPPGWLLVLVFFAAMLLAPLWVPGALVILTVRKIRRFWAAGRGEGT